MAKKYDFIIAGGGTSGIITATKLIEHGASVLILEEGMAQRPSDIDVVWLNGYGFPRDKGGLLFWANKIGSSRILEGLKKMEDDGLQINISGMLKDMAKKNENIFDTADQKIRV